MDRPAITPTELEDFLDFSEETARITAEGFVRWVLTRADPERRIVAETIYPMQATGWAGAYPKALVEEERPWLLAAWADVDARYFTASLDETGGLYVHTAALPESWVIEGLHGVLDRGMKGKAPDHSRAEQLAASAGHAQALRAWDLDDDSVGAPGTIDGARCRLSFVANGRAKLRWGMLPISADSLSPVARG